MTHDYSTLDKLDDKLSSKNRVLLLGEGWELVFPRRYSLYKHWLIIRLSGCSYVCVSCVGNLQ